MLSSALTDAYNHPPQFVSSPYISLPIVCLPSRTLGSTAPLQLVAQRGSCNVLTRSHCFRNPRHGTRQQYCVLGSRLRRCLPRLWLLGLRWAPTWVEACPPSALDLDRDICGLGISRVAGTTLVGSLSNVDVCRLAKPVVPSWTAALGMAEKRYMLEQGTGSAHTHKETR